MWSALSFCFIILSSNVCFFNEICAWKNCSFFSKDIACLVVVICQTFIIFARNESNKVDVLFKSTHFRRTELDVNYKTSPLEWKLQSSASHNQSREESNFIEWIAALKSTQFYLAKQKKNKKIDEDLLNSREHSSALSNDIVAYITREENKDYPERNHE